MVIPQVDQAIGTVRNVGNLMLVISEILALADPRVTIDQGRLRGFKMKSKNGKEIMAFKGIPYAAPPVGNLRFRSPQEAPAWNEERKAIKEGNKCLQKNLLQITEGSEDCLYLNVYTPQIERKGGGLSVMVWIHGGSFSMGSGDADIYTPDFLLDHNVILVTFNYRLGAFGFLSLGTIDAPGNYGLKDQIAVLKWIQKNISKFGGNPNSVTIFGQSAGSVSVQCLLLSPLTKGLFHKAISQSGSILNPWAFDNNAAEIGNFVSQSLRCKRIGPEQTLACLRRLDKEKLLEIAPTLMKRFRKDLAFVPTIEPREYEGAVINNDPRILMQTGQLHDIPLLIGLTSHEGMLQLGALNGKSVKADYEDNKNRFLEAFGLNKNSKEGKFILSRIEMFYSNLTRNDLTEQYIMMLTDVAGTLGIDEFIRRYKLINRNHIFYYQFSYDGGLNYFKILTSIRRKGAAHSDDIGYLFGTMFPLWLLSSQTDQLNIYRMTKMWTDFAKFSHPTPTNVSVGVLWKPVMNPTITRYLDINKNLIMKEESLNENRINFWKSLRSYVIK